MKSIITISRLDFQRELFKINNGTLKQLLEGLFEFIKHNADKYPMDAIIDLERKQSIIWKELMRRGILTKKTQPEFQRWLYNKHKKKVF